MTATMSARTGAQKLTKANSATPALVVTGPIAIGIAAGTRWGGAHFSERTPLILPTGLLKPGSDYGVSLDEKGVPQVARLSEEPSRETYFAGFHFAPGGNAPARTGGDSESAINRHSLWDVGFRPACADPRGMALVEGSAGRFWVDIYLTGADHLDNGTSKFGVTIADHSDPPQKPGGGRFGNFNYEAARAVMAHHGKALLQLDEFFATAYGVTEKTARGHDPKITRLDAARTSKFGLMQAAGNMWVWGHDGDPDEPRASVFGGSWLLGGDAGSRYAFVGYWPGFSSDALGARGRCDHLQLD
jgi:hypothetical protein